MAAKAQQPINVVCATVNEKFYAADNDLYITMNGTDYAFGFDIICATGATDIVDGQTYTWNDMFQDYSYGVDNINQAYIDYTAVSFVRNSDGSYVADVTATDGTQYHITYAPAAVDPIDTIDLTLNNAAVNEVTDYTAAMGLFQLKGADQNQEYTMYLVVNSDQIAGSYTQDDVNFQYSSMVRNDSTDLIDIDFIRVSDFTVAGNVWNCSTYVEILGSDRILYRINYTYTYVAPVPTDSVEITMDNAEFNQVIATDGMAGILGADQNEEYVMQLVVYSDQLAGNYTKWDVLVENILYHLTANDTTLIDIIEIRDFTITGDTTNCSAYIEMVSADLVLYKITFTYATEPDAVETANETEFVVCSEGDAIMVYSEGEQNIAVFDMAGRMITYRQNASDIERIEISVPGIYVVRVGNKAVKAVVK